MWVLITYRPHDNHDDDYGTPPQLSNMFSPGHWGTLEMLAPFKKKVKKILEDYFDKNKP